jgi:hypothetical protein
MKIKLLSRTLVILFGVTGCAASALAGNMVEVNGLHTKFIYDADFWGANNVTVQGDTISFATGHLYSAIADVAVGQEPDYTVETWTTNGVFRGVLAVAKDSYKLDAAVGNAIHGEYSVDSGGQVMTYSNGYVVGGSWSNGVFSEQSALGNYHSQFAVGSAGGMASSGGWDSNSVSSGPAQRYDALALSLGLTGWVQQSGPGQSSASIEQVTFSFSSVLADTPVSSVPEPSTYGMMAGGLALLGMVSRRRKCA